MKTISTPLKNITKSLILTSTTLLLCFVVIRSNAQQKLGAGLTFGRPGNSYSFAFNADLRYQFDLNRRFSIPITVGYTNFSRNFVQREKGLMVPGFALYTSYIPVKSGVKYFVNNAGSGLYGLAELGVGFGISRGANTAFVYAPAIGYSWELGLDFAAKYEGYSDNGNLGYIGVRLAYDFRL